jgi:hypothetical protein
MIVTGPSRQEIRQRTSRRKKSPAQGGPARGSSTLGLGGKMSALDSQNATGARLFRVLPKYLLNPGKSHALLSLRR